MCITANWAGLCRLGVTTRSYRTATLAPGPLPDSGHKHTDATKLRERDTKETVSRLFNAGGSLVSWIKSASGGVADLVMPGSAHQGQVARIDAYRRGIVAEDCPVVSLSLIWDNGTVPPVMWLEFALRDLQRREAI